jgi:small multidrug resistance pump
MSRDRAEEVLDRFRPWLAAAAIYNLLWGSITIVFPDALFRFLRMPLPSYLPLWQVVGMFVLVYAPAYGWAARRPSAHGHLILVGMLGKILGPLGFLWALASGQLPLRFGLVILTNDLLWWPAFACYLQAAARVHGGWKAFLLGD